jgi:hypothetical protein
MCREKLPRTAPRFLLRFDTNRAMSEEARSLWEQFDSEVEPWRRGRAILVIIACGYLILQALSITADIAAGNIERLLAFSTGCVFFWLQFYFTWIGVHWVRWIVGGWSAVLGFVWLIWGVRGSNSLMLFFAAANLLIGSYFCLSSSVHFFAKRQREKRNWTRSLLVGAAFGLLFLSFYFGSIGLLAYKHRLEVEAREFADDAFRRIFSDHDTYFFLDTLSEEALMKNGGRANATRFLQSATMQAGDVHDIKSATGQLKVTYNFPAKLACAGIMTSEAVGERGSIDLKLKLVEVGRSWKIETAWWAYRSQLR